MHKNILMTRAFNAQREIVAINEVERGRACQCTCIVCGSSLIAKQGSKNKHSFAHDSEAVCDWSGETELHILAKEVLQEDKEILFTHLSLDGIPYKIKVPFISVEQEVMFDHLRPDIQGTTIDGDSILIEICVTHPCDDKKIEYYRKQRINVLEVILPPSLLDNIQILDLDYVRKAIKSAEIKCISINALSKFANYIYNKNQLLISEQGNELRRIRKNLNDKINQFIIETQKEEKLQESIKCLEGSFDEISQKAKQYKYQLNQEIQSQNHVLQYRKEVKTYTTLRDKLRRDHASEIIKLNKYEKELNDEIESQEYVQQYREDVVAYNRMTIDIINRYQLKKESIENEIKNYEENLKKEVREHVLHEEVSRLRLEIAELKIEKNLLQKDGILLTIKEYIQMLDAKYENHLYELECHGYNLKRLKPHLQKPDFFSHDNHYEKIRG